MKKNESFYTKLAWGIMLAGIVIGVLVFVSIAMYRG